MFRAAFFALPMPVRHAASVSTPASVAAETEERRMSLTSVSASSAESPPYRIPTTGRARKNSPAAHGTESSKVSNNAHSARFLPSSSLPLAKQAETTGTLAAASP